MYYYVALLLIIDYCYPEPCTTNCDNCFDTQRPTIPSGLYTIAQTLRQKQYFENLQKYLGRLEKDSISKNHNDHFQMQQREITHRGA